MKKRMQLLALCILMFLILFFVMRAETKQIRLFVDDAGNMWFEVATGTRDQNIELWYNNLDEKHYVFLPSFCESENIYISELSHSLLFCEQKGYERGDKLTFEVNRDYVFEIINAERDSIVYNIEILKSENLPTIFIDTASGSMDYLLESGENEEPGFVSIIRAEGNTEYSGSLEKITGRGNASWWGSPKKSYAFTLNTEEAICGMEESRKWNLHAVFVEGSRMATKIALDMAQYIELDAVMNGTWVDLYLNGEYAGNYLLSEAVRVEDNRVEIYDLEKENRMNNADIENASTFMEENLKGYELANVDTISGGFLIEKDSPIYYELEEAGFVTKSENTFTIKAPQHASREQVEYIYAYIQNIESLIEAGEEEVWEYLDIDSFAKRYVIDEISLNVDANITSTYFYKDKDNDILYAGPVWDYNLGFGECNTDWADGAGIRYTGSINDSDRVNSWIRLEWFALLCEQPEFQAKIREYFIEMLPYMEWVLDEGINQYEEMLEESLEMEAIRWEVECPEGEKEGNYVEYENNVRYLKYFITNRLNYLIDKWEIPHEKFVFTGNGDTHTVVYMLEDEILRTQSVLDSDVIKTVPPLDEEVYSGWYYTFNNQKNREYLPILEDCTLYARKK